MINEKNQTPDVSGGFTSASGGDAAWGMPGHDFCGPRNEAGGESTRRTGDAEWGIDCDSPTVQNMRNDAAASKEEKLWVRATMLMGMDETGHKIKPSSP